MAVSVLDIVFVHGLGGDRMTTWGEGDKFWPTWLAEDFPDCAIYAAGFDSRKLAGRLTGDGASIRDIASGLAAGLLIRPVRAPRMILITHSLGGLVVKQMLRMYADSQNPKHRELAASVCGVVFLATPHQGARLASVMSSIFSLVMSKQAKQLQYDGEELVELQSGFANWAIGANVDVRPFYETEKTGTLHIVDRVTANPNIAGAEPVGVQSDHIQICKPATRDDLVYASVTDMVEEHKPAPSGESSRKALAPDILSDFEFYTAVAPDDRRDLSQKLTDAGRTYQIGDAHKKKERFNMALQRNIAQPAAVTRYTRLLADVETRFSRHVKRMAAHGVPAADIDRVVETDVIAPCVEQHSSLGSEISAALVDSAIYYLAGNCHVGWDDA
jgi:pimeloyl-ACP methyl ester carboxylesterase